MSSSKKKKIGHILFLEDVFIPLLENRGYKVLVLSICPHVCPIALYLLLPQIGRIDFKLCGPVHRKVYMCMCVFHCWTLHFVGVISLWYLNFVSTTPPNFLKESTFSYVILFMGKYISACVFLLLNVAFCWSSFPLILKLCIHYSKVLKGLTFIGRYRCAIVIFIGEFCILVVISL